MFLLKMVARELVFEHKEHSPVTFSFYLRVKEGPFSGFWNLTYPDDTTEGGQVRDSVKIYRNNC